MTLACYRCSGIFVGLLLACSNLVAQNLPITQVWLLEIENGVPTNPKLISASERYNNQPMFSPDSKVVYFTVLIPWGLLLLFVIRGLTLSGAGTGIDRE